MHPKNQIVAKGSMEDEGGDDSTVDYAYSADILRQRQAFCRVIPQQDKRLCRVVRRGTLLRLLLQCRQYGPYISLDDTCLSNGEVWTFLTNKYGHGGRGTLAVAIPGTKSDEIISILVGAMSKSVRRKVKEVTCDLSSSMMLIAAEVFYNAHVVNDRFHVQQV